MKQIELNVRKSFAEVRKDIIEIKNQLLKISETQQKLQKSISKNINSNNKTKVVEKCRVKEYVASKTGKSFHIPSCPYAQNIKPKHKVKFKSTTAARNAGYKSDSCVK